MNLTKKRPKLNIPKTKSEWVWDILGYSCYVGSIILLIIVWGKLPDKAPAHINGAGEVTRWGSKWVLAIIPTIGLFSGLFMQAFEYYPEIYNYPKRFNESNAKQFYLNGRKMINQMKNIMLSISSLMLLEMTLIALDWHNGFGKWFLPLIISAIFIPMIIGMIRQSKIK